MKQIEIFETTDGQRFDDASEAERHQKHLNNADKVEAFLDKYYPIPTSDGAKKGPSRSIAKKAVELWLEEN